MSYVVHIEDNVKFDKFLPREGEGKEEVGVVHIHHRPLLVSNMRQLCH